MKAVPWSKPRLAARLTPLTADGSRPEATPSGSSSQLASAIRQPYSGSIQPARASSSSRSALPPRSTGFPPSAWSLSTRPRYPLSLRRMSDQAWGQPRAEADGLSVWLRAPTGRAPAAGAGTALFVHGAAVHRNRPVRRIELLAGGTPARAMATAMPSPTLAAETGSVAAARSIFWGIVAPATGAATPELELTRRARGRRQHPGGARRGNRRRAARAAQAGDAAPAWRSAWPPTSRRGAARAPARVAARADRTPTGSA